MRYMNLEIDQSKLMPMSEVVSYLKTHGERYGSLADEQERGKALAAQAEADKPKVLFADAVSASDDCVLIRELAKILSQNGADIGEKRLFEWLRRGGYLVRKQGRDHNSPTQRAMTGQGRRARRPGRQAQDRPHHAGHRQGPAIFPEQVFGRGQIREKRGGAEGVVASQTSPAGQGFSIN